MSTYKGIGFDTATARTRTGTNADNISFDSLITATDGVDVTGVGLVVGAGGASITGGTTSDTLTVSGDASVGGDLTVAGDIISRGQVDLVIQDNFLDLNAGNNSTTALASGFTFTMNRAGAFNTGTVTTFVAGVAGNSNPTFTNTNAGTSTPIAQFDVVFIAGATEGSNDGLYVVSAVSGASFPQTVTIKGVGTTGIPAQLPFAQSQFTADTGDTAEVYKVDLKVMAVADGASFANAGGVQFPKGTMIEVFAPSAVESSFTDDGDYAELGSASSLQIAYNTGNLITTAGSRDIALTLASGNLTASGAGQVLLTPTGASSLTSGAGLTLTGGSASVFSTSAGDLDLKAGANLAIQGSGTGTIGIGNANAGNITVSTGASFAVSGEANSTITVDGANVELRTLNSGDVDIASASAVDINAGAGVTVDGTTIAIAGTGASLLKTTSADLTVQTVTSGTLLIASSALLDIDAGANLDVDVTGTIDLQASSTFSIDGTGASNVTATSGDLTLATATSGNLVLTGATRMTATSTDIMSFTMNASDAGTKSIDIIANNGGGGDAQVQIDADNFVKIQTGGNDRLTIGNGLAVVQPKLVINATNGLQFGSESTLADSLKDEDNMVSNDANALATQQSIKAYVDGNGATAYNRITILLADGSGIVERDVVAINASGQATKADANAIGSCRVIGLALNTASSGNAVQIAQVGKLGGYSGLTAGNVLYASATVLGAVSATIPSGNGDVVVQVGYASSTTEIVIQPLFRHGNWIIFLSCVLWHREYCPLPMPFFMLLF